jgi:alkylhydroperoxidase family enzyme
MELFRFAGKLTRQPADMEKGDVERLREVGWTDDQILETVLVASLYACANRFSAGVGLVADF